MPDSYRKIIGDSAACPTYAWTIALTLLVVLSCPIAARGQEKLVIGDKTLVAWVSPSTLTQRGGSALTIEKTGGVFDAIVFGEIAPARWMAGSNGFARTKVEQEDFASETADSQALVAVAIVYRGNQITIYRNGSLYADYMANGSERFEIGSGSGIDSLVLMGLRHTSADRDHCAFHGTIEDARLYGVALDAEQIAALQPNQPSDPQPLAWWDFEEGRARDRMELFPTTTLIGEARLADGRLHLDSGIAYLMATTTVPEASVDFSQTDSLVRAHRERLLSDPYRPGYHFVTPEGRCMPFDPNGAIFWKGRYHLFYIFQDARGHNWGHVSSTDMFHWRHHPTGLVDGMFSGNCFLNEFGRPTMCYHQVGQGNAMAVAADDELNEWTKLDSNPITPPTQPGDPHHDKYRSWDPFGWLEKDTYYAIFGGERPAIAKSPDLAGPWQYVGDLMANSVEGVSIDEDVSCADFFPLGNKQMLLCISHRLGCRYYLGEWKDEAFHPTYHAKMSWVDNSFFAPESLLDDQGRRIMWAWIFDQPEFATRMEYGWSGTMSLPRVLALDEEGLLRMDPPSEIEQLRYNGRTRSPLTIPTDSQLVLDGISGNSLELNLEIVAPNAAQFGVKVCCSPGGEEQTLVYYDAVEKALKVDTNKSSLTEGSKSIEAGPLELSSTEPLKLRVFVDKSVVEVFANGRQAVMRRIYPSLPESVGVAIFARGGPADITSLQAWDMSPSNPY
ncbi:MAG: GH32 C-terminal domain-containing protein [Pirellulaceae bacterium]